MTHPRTTPTGKKIARTQLTGIICGIIAALGYTSAHTFLRALSMDTDPAWVSCVKAACTVVIFVPWLIWLNSRGRFTMPPYSTIAVLILSGLFVQVAGNLLYQICLGEIGLALTVPLLMGSMIVSTAFVGKWVLGEMISRRLWVALFVLIAAIAILSIGVQYVQQSSGQQNPLAPELAERTENDEQVGSWSPWVFGLMACVSGMAYSFLGISISWATRRTPISLATPMVIVGMCGVVGLGLIVYWDHGTAILHETSANQWRAMLLAGLSNSTAFLALTYALRVLPVIYVNAINVTQIAMAALIGVLFFKESLTIYLIIGLTLMLLGFSIMKRSRSTANAEKAMSK